MLSERPVYAEVDLSAIRHNLRAVGSLLRPATRLCAVVKADAYGHGATGVAGAAAAAGADCLAVAILDEAVELRAAGFTQDILILGFTPPASAHAVAAHNITQTICTIEQARALSAAALAAGKEVRVHLKVDTGMGRLGVRPEEAGAFARAAAELPGLVIEGVYTHFAKADARDKTHARRQFAIFGEALADIGANGVKPAILHCANSAAAIDMPETHLDMVRIGIAAYGLWPSPEVDRSRIRLCPAMRFKTGVAYVKSVPAGTGVSYGGIFTTTRPSVIATLPVGYADGWPRMLSGRAQTIIRGVRAPLVGRICMDQCMVDVTDIPDVRIGDEALLFGGPELPADEIAQLLGTINYEITCMVGKRVPRRYV